MTNIPYNHKKIQDNISLKDTFTLENLKMFFKENKSFFSDFDKNHLRNIKKSLFDFHTWKNLSYGKVIFTIHPDLWQLVITKREILADLSDIINKIFNLYYKFKIKNSWKHLVLLTFKKYFKNDPKVNKIINNIYKNNSEFFVNIEEIPPPNNL